MARSAPVLGLCADCPGHFGLRMTAVHDHGCVWGAELWGVGNMTGMLEVDPACYGNPSQGGVGLLNPSPCSPHSKQSLLAQPEHPALHSHGMFAATSHTLLVPFITVLESIALPSNTHSASQQPDSQETGRNRNKGCDKLA